MPELFEKVEVNGESRTRVLLQLVAGSLAIHLILVWAVIYVPALRDTLNIVALIANTKFVEKPYNRTEIGDEVQMLARGEELPPRPTPPSFPPAPAKEGIVPQAKPAKPPLFGGPEVAPA